MSIYSRPPTTEAEMLDALVQSGVREGFAEDVERAVPRFVEIENDHFKAKYGVVSEDVVIQFFVPDAVMQLVAKDRSHPLVEHWNKLWADTFPRVLSLEATEYFQATRPRVVAKYTEELASWWFCARGFGVSSIDPLALAKSFLGRLQGALQRELAQPS